MARRRTDAELDEMRQNAKRLRRQALNNQGGDPARADRDWRMAEHIEADIRTEMNLRARRT